MEEPASKLAKLASEITWQGADGLSELSILNVLRREMPEQFPSNSSTRKAVNRQQVRVNGALCVDGRTMVQAGDVVTVLQAAPPGSPGEAAAAGGGALQPVLPCVFEDDTLAVVVKPQGIPTQRTTGKGRCVKASLAGSVRRSAAPDALPKALAVHRLDEPTGGLLLVAKTAAAARLLPAAFRDRDVKKRYRAVVCRWVVKDRGEVHHPVDSKPAHTEYTVVARTPSHRHGWITTIDLFPHTGRTHQLRKHMAMIGHPIYGDRRYTYGYAKLHPDVSQPEGGPPSQGLASGQPEEALPALAPDAEAWDHSPAGPGEHPARAREPASRCGQSGGRECGSTEKAVLHDDNDGDLDENVDAVGNGLSGEGQGEDVAQRDSPANDIDALLCLWALELTINHPDTGQPVTFEIPEPGHYEKVRDYESSGKS